MGVAGTGVTQPEAALEVAELLAGCGYRRLLAGRMRARQRGDGYCCRFDKEALNDCTDVLLVARPTRIWPRS
jgi:hypothetical protein